MSLYQEQKVIKPKVEEAAPEFLSGEKLQNLLSFVEFLKKNKLTPRWQSSNSWSVKYKNKTVCYVKIITHSHNVRVESFWAVYHSNFTREKWFRDYDGYFTDDGLKQFVLDNILAPTCIEKDCKGVQNKMIFGKKFDAVCHCWPIRLTNPEGEAFEYSKMLVLAIKSFIADMAQCPPVSFEIP